MFAHLKTATTGTVTALALIASTVAPAEALGKRDREILLGITAAVIAGAIINEARSDNRPRGVVIEPEPQTYAPEPARVHTPQVSNSVYRTPAAQAFNGYSGADRRAIQQKLKAYGYYRRGIDGAFGPGTYNAVLAFAADNGLSGNLRTAAEARGIYDALIY